MYIMKINLFEVAVSRDGLVRRPQTGALLRLSSIPWPEGLPTDWGPSSELLPSSARWSDRSSIWLGAGQMLGFGVWAWAWLTPVGVGVGVILGWVWACLQLRVVWVGVVCGCGYG